MSRDWVCCGVSVVACSIQSQHFFHGRAASRAPFLPFLSLSLFLFLLFLFFLSAGRKETTRVDGVFEGRDGSRDVIHGGGKVEERERGEREREARMKHRRQRDRKQAYSKLI